MANLKRNIGYQSIYFVISTIISIVIAPYISRVLGAEKLGIFSYTSSIVVYFELIAALGFSSYGVRSIASIAADKEKRSRVFSSIFLLQIIMSILAIGLYSVYLYFFCTENKIIAVAQGISLLSVMIDINWLFAGMEDFKFISIRNIIIRIAIAIFVFVFVKSKDDLIIYVVLMCLQVFLANFVLWVRLPQYVHLEKSSFNEIFSHLKPNIILSIPVAAMLLYSFMDKTMLGIMSSYNETGYYYNADLIVSSILRGTIMINSVMAPRIASSISYNGKGESEKIFSMSYNMIAFVFTGAAFGVAAVSNEFVPLYFGKEFTPCIDVLFYLSPIIMIKACGSAVRQQYLIPNRKDRLYALSNTFALIVNIIMNFIFIKQMGALGAVIGTLTAESVSFFIPVISIRKEINILNILKKGIPYLCSGFLMLIIVRFLAEYLRLSYLSLGIEIVCGAIIYLIFVFVYDSKFNSGELIKILKKLKS